jgi:hypothetical protein
MRKSIEEEKLDFIGKRIGNLKRSIVGLEKTLYTAILNQFLSKLDTEKGQITNTPQNISLISLIDKIYESFNLNHHSELTDQYAKDLIRIGLYNETYYNSIVDEAKEDINEKLRNRSLRVLGIEKKEAKATLKKGGYLDLFLNDNVIKTQIKRRALLAVQVGMSIQDLRKTIATDIITTKQKEGLLKRYWRQNAVDTYSAFDRATGNALAEEYGITAFLYSAGTESDSRHFCRHNNNKVFLNEEIEEWKDLANKKRGGKIIGPIVESKSSYNPKTQQGGINCKHSLRGISNRMALRLDNTLFEEKGKLIRKKGENPNKDL